VGEGIPTAELTEVEELTLDSSEDNSVTRQNRLKQ
jgi:hypothetical protein